MSTIGISRAGILIVLVTLSRAADTGKIVGIANPTNPLDACHRGGIAWTMTADCRTSYRTAIDDQKRFVFEAIPPGTYQVMAVCGVSFSSLTDEIRVRPWETATVELHVEYWDGEDGKLIAPPRPVNGRILDGAGRPLAGAIVADRRKDVLVGGGASSVSGPDGRFGFCQVIPGRIPLEVKREGYRTRTIQLTLDNFNTAPLEIKLRKQ